MFSGVRVQWKNYPSLLLPGEDGIPARELHRRQLEAGAQSRANDLHQDKLIRTKDARLRLRHLVGLANK